MLSLRNRLPWAIAVVVLGALAALIATTDPETSIIILAGGIAAVLVAAGTSHPAPPPRPAPPPPAEPMPVAEAIEAIIEPVLIVADTRVIRANSGARELLGQHIIGEDVRVAIRHPAAAERLIGPPDLMPSAPIHLVGLGARDQRWEMRVHDVEGDQRVVHLVDRTGAYTAERMRVDFVANASHELKTPLASLLGYVETLREDDVDDPAMRSRFFQIMHGEARRMQRLIEDLISLSRIEADKYRAPSETVDLAALVEEVRAELEAGADEGRIIVEAVDVPPVKGDRAQLSQLLHNIMGNALKYGRPGTPVTVAIRLSNAMVQLSVADQGEGIPPEHLPRLTERFYRVDSGRSRAVGGTGLGLSIVKHVVERHRGRLDIASVVGTGTTVTILLPVQTVIKA